MKHGFTLIPLALAAVLACGTGCSKENVIVKESGSSLHFVDLGLSVKWADSNLGASAPEENGEYYAFAELETKDDYRMETYKWAAPNEKGHYLYTKYNGQDDKRVLDKEDDAVRARLGSKYRLPSEAEVQELRDSCTWTWSTLNGVNGYKVTSNVKGYKGRYIFFPASGLREETAPAVTGHEGYYLTSSLYETGPYRLAFSPEGIAIGVTASRYNGFSIRAVTEKPVPALSELKVYTKDFIVREFSVKESVAQKKVYVEAYSSAIDREKGYNPYMLCLDKNGKVLWGWTGLSKRISSSSTNWTMFDVTSDGGVIECYNAVTDSTVIHDEYGDYKTAVHNPFVTKLDSDGQHVWGSAPEYDIPLYEFTGDFISYSPIGSYTVSDNAGGAWVAAWSEPKEDDIIAKKVCNQMVFVHLDKDGKRISTPYVLNNASGTFEQRSFVNRAQMYTDNDNNLYAIVLYQTIVGATSYGYYDLVGLASDGTFRGQELLMSDRSILGEIRARITKDGKGGAYITMAAVNEADECNRLWMYHVAADGSIDAKDIDLTPEYCTASIKTGHAIDPQTGNIAVITMDSYPPGSRDAKEYLYYMVLDSKGNKIVSDNGRPIVLRHGDDRNDLDDNDFKVIYRPETGKIFISYIYEGYMMFPQMKMLQADFKGNVSEEITLFNLDRHYYSNIDEESQTYDFIDGNLLYFFRPNTDKKETTDFYGYVLKQ